MATVTVGSLPGEVDLTGKRGDRWGPFQFTPRTSLDLTGRTWLAQIRATQDRPAEVLATIAVDADDAATGVLRITVLPVETSKLTTGTTLDLRGVQIATPGKGTYFWDIQSVSDTDPTDVKTWFGGKVIVLGDVSEGS